MTKQYPSASDAMSSFGAALPRERLLRRYAPRNDTFVGLQFHSITSSARSKIAVGTSMPSVLRVLRLITISNLVGVCTGRSPTFSPLRMRST
jgi:hypothetical protein